jgi:LPXTG-motif cell wall-anchored protein
MKASVCKWAPGLVVAVAFFLATGLNAQVQTQTTTAPSGSSTKQVTVERAEVVLVNGNDLVVKLEDGTLRHFPNIPESARITVDGKQLGIHDLKPGMKLERTTVVTTTPKTITTTKSVTGTVWHVNPPRSVILTLEDGSNQSFNIPSGQKFNVDGQMVDAWGLKKGMKISATKVVEEPIMVSNQSRSVTGTMPQAEAPAPPPADVPILIAQEKAPVVPASDTAAAPAKLPKTGTELPLIGLLGLLFSGAGLGLRLFRK